MTMVTIDGVRYTLDDAIDQGLLERADLDTVRAATPVAGSVPHPKRSAPARASRSKPASKPPAEPEAEEVEEPTDAEAEDEADADIPVTVESTPVHSGRRTARN
ncbi:MAG: hypothetical protein Q3999_05115 [Buchananella hordeovulneris]|nr:hypothetical protein [Buchananella hordeovulneris]